MVNKLKTNHIDIFCEIIDHLERFDAMSGRRLVKKETIESYKQFVTQIDHITAKITDLNKQLEQTSFDDAQEIEIILIDLYRQYYTISATMAEISEEIRQIFLFIKSMRDLN